MNSKKDTRPGFVDPYPVDTAITTLHNLRMKGTAEEYMVKFTQAAAIAQLDDTSLIAYMKRGLNPALTKKIMESAPTTLGHWKNRALQYDRAFQEAQNLAKDPAWTRISKAVPARSPNAPSETKQPMRTPTGLPRTTPTPGLVKREGTPTVKREDRANVVCYRCGGKGHFAGDHAKLDAPDTAIKAIEDETEAEEGEEQGREVPEEEDESKEDFTED